MAAAARASEASNGRKGEQRPFAARASEASNGRKGEQRPFAGAEEEKCGFTLCAMVLFGFKRVALRRDEEA